MLSKASQNGNVRVHSLLKEIQLRGVLFQHVNESGKKGGLNGGSSVSPTRALQSLARAKENMDNV